MINGVTQAGANLEGLRFNFNREYQHAQPLTIANRNLADAAALDTLAPAQGLSDLRGEAVALFGLSSKVAGGGHGSGYGALSSAASRGGVPTAISIDSWLSRQPGVDRQTPFETIRLGVVPKVDQRLQYGLCAFGARRPAPIVVDPNVAFNSLFGSIAEGPAQRAFNSRSDLLSFAAQDVRRALNEFVGSVRSVQSSRPIWPPWRHSPRDRLVCSRQKQSCVLLYQHRLDSLTYSAHVIRSSASRHSLSSRPPPYSGTHIGGTHFLRYGRLWPDVLEP